MSPRPSKFSFLIDEGFPVPAGKFFEAKGHNVSYASLRRELRGATDLQLLRIATKERRIFVTVDRDVATDESLQGEIAKGHGVILIESTDPGEKHVRQILARVLQKLPEKRIDGKICRATVTKIDYLPSAE